MFSSPPTRSLLVTRTHTSLAAPSPRLLFCLGVLALFLWRAVSFPERSKWPRLRRTLPLQLLIWLRAFFPGSKELSFPLVHADPGGLSNLLAKCLYFYSCLCGNVYEMDISISSCLSHPLQFFSILSFFIDFIWVLMCLVSVMAANFSCVSHRR